MGMRISAGYRYSAGVSGTTAATGTKDQIREGTVLSHLDRRNISNSLP